MEYNSIRFALSISSLTNYLAVTGLECTLPLPQMWKLIHYVDLERDGGHAIHMPATANLTEEKL